MVFGIGFMKKSKLLISLLFSGIIAFTTTAFAEDSVYLKELGDKLKAAVKAGEMTAKEARAKYKAAASGESSDTAISINGFFVGAGKEGDGKQKAAIIVPGKEKDKSKWPRITFTGESLVSQFDALQKRGAVIITIDDGETKKSVAGKGGQLAMKKRVGKGGSPNFYSIVIGRMKTKDIELGEFTLDVDYATVNRFGGLKIKEEIVGKTIKVTGVSGQFRDNLLLIRKGQTLKVRTSSYSSETKTLSFAHKFNVLERALPFSPDDHGVPPESFRGFEGTLQGKIIESGGYELLLQVEDVKTLADNNKAQDAMSIKGRRVRIAGFYDDHADEFNGLLPNDTIRVGMRHRDRAFDIFDVTDLLEVIEQ